MIENQVSHYLKENGFDAIRLKAVLFDMDGVLFDSMPTHAKAWMDASKKYNLGLSELECYEHEGRTAKSTLDMLFMRKDLRHVTDKEVEEIYQYKIERYNSYNIETRPIQGAAELLQKVREDGLQTILVTGSGQTTLMNRLQRFFPDIFHRDTMVTSRDVTQGKPSPEPYLKALELAHVKPWEAIVVENAPLGIEAGVKARVFTIALNTGPLNDSVLQAQHPNILFHSMTEFCNLWDELKKDLL